VNAVLADSDVIIEVLKQGDREILSKWDELGRSEAVSVMTCAPIDEEIGRKAGDCLRLF